MIIQINTELDLEQIESANPQKDTVVITSRYIKSMKKAYKLKIKAIKKIF